MRACKPSEDTVSSGRPGAGLREGRPWKPWGLPQEVAAQRQRNKDEVGRVPGTRHLPHWPSASSLMPLTSQLMCVKKVRQEEEDVKVQTVIMKQKLLFTA